MRDPQREGAKKTYEERALEHARSMSLPPSPMKTVKANDRLNSPSATPKRSSSVTPQSTTSGDLSALEEELPQTPTSPESTPTGSADVTPLTHLEEHVLTGVQTTKKTKKDKTQKAAAGTGEVNSPPVQSMTEEEMKIKKHRDESVAKLAEKMEEARKKEEKEKREKWEKEAAELRRKIKKLEKENTKKERELTKMQVDFDKEREEWQRTQEENDYEDEEEYEEEEEEEDEEEKKEKKRKREKKRREETSGESEEETLTTPKRSGRGRKRGEAPRESGESESEEEECDKPAQKRKRAGRRNEEDTQNQVQMVNPRVFTSFMEEEEEEQRDEGVEKALKKAEEIAEHYRFVGMDVIRNHQMFEAPEAERVRKRVLWAMQRSDGSGRSGEIPFESDEKKQIGKIQEFMADVDTELQHGTLQALLKDVFGISRHMDEEALWVKVNLSGLMAALVGLNPSGLQAQLKKAKRRAQERSKPAPYAGASLKELKGAELSLVKIKDLLKNPEKWEEFIMSSQDYGVHRRELLDGLTAKYLTPLSFSSNRVQKQQSYEVEDILWELELLITPMQDVEIPKKVKEMHLALMLRKIERLETIRIFLKDPAVGTEFARLVKKDPPSKKKDLEKLKEEAMKIAEKKPFKNMSRDVTKLAHLTRGVLARPGPTVERRSQRTVTPQLIRGRSFSSPAGRYPNGPPRGTPRSFRPRGGRRGRF